MNYSVNAHALKKAMDFINREIEETCLLLRRWKALEQEKSGLQARRQQVQHLIGQVFSYGGEKIALNKQPTKNQQRLEKEIAECRRKAANLGVARDAYLETAAFLEKWEKTIVNPDKTGILFSKKSPQSLAPELMARKDSNMKGLLGLKTLLLKSFLRGADETVIEQALIAAQDYTEQLQSAKKPIAAEYLEVVSYLCLRDILNKLQNGGRFEENDKQRMLKTFRDLPKQTSVYQVLSVYRGVAGTGFLEKEELLLLGYFDECISKPLPDQMWYAKAWLTCFNKALQSQDYNSLMQRFILDGFPNFFDSYMKNEKTSLREVLNTCLNNVDQYGQNSQHALLRFEEYGSIFQKKVTEQVEKDDYTRLVIDTLYGLEEAGKLPRVKKMKKRSGGDAIQEVALCCVAQIRENPMEQILNPVFWDVSRIEKIAGELYWKQMAPVRKEKRSRIAAFCVMAPLGVWMGTGDGAFYAAVLLLIILICASPGSGRKDRALLVSFALSVIASETIGMRSYSQILNFVLKKEISGGQMVFLVVLFLVLPLFLYFYALIQGKKEFGKGKEDRYPVIIYLMTVLGLWMGSSIPGFLSGLPLLFVFYALPESEGSLERVRRFLVCNNSYLVTTLIGYIERGYLGWLPFGKFGTPTYQIHAKGTALAEKYGAVGYLGIMLLFVCAEVVPVVAFGVGLFTGGNTRRYGKRL